MEDLLQNAVTSAAPAVDQITGLLGAKHGWIPALIGWVGTARLCIKPFSAWLLKLMNWAISYVHSTEEEDDDHLLARGLTSLPWRMFAALSDYFASTKLPTRLPPKPPATPPPAPTETK